MGIIMPDFSDIKTGAPEGTYKARIVSNEIKKSQKGDTYIKWKLMLFGSEGELTYTNGWNVYYNTMAEGAGKKMLFDFIKAVTGAAPKSGVEFNTDNLNGGEVEVTLVYDLQPTGERSNFPNVKAVKAIR